jgi:hypothetical protein
MSNERSIQFQAAGRGLRALVVAKIKALVEFLPGEIEGESQADEPDLKVLTTLKSTFDQAQTILKAVA